jgi:hypothetical protein
MESAEKSRPWWRIAGRVGGLQGNLKLFVGGTVDDAHDVLSGGLGHDGLGETS